MTRSKLLGAAVLGCLLLLGTGCQKYQMMPSMKLSEFNTNPATTPNELEFLNIHLEIHEGWSFLTKNKEVRADTPTLFEAELFEITDNKGNVSGHFRYTDFPDLNGNIVPEKLAKAYVEDFIKGVVNIQVYPTYINAQLAYVVSGTVEGKGWDFMAALIPEGSAYNEIVLFSDPDYFKLNPEVAYNIFSSYKVVENDKSMRRIAGLPEFLCTDGTWRWALDDTGNTLTSYAIADGDKSDIIAIKVGTLNLNTVEDFKQWMSQSEKETYVSEFPTQINVGGQDISATGLIYNLNSGGKKIYYIIKGTSTMYLVVVMYEKKPAEITDEKVHQEWPELRQALTQYIRFTEGQLDPSGYAAPLAAPAAAETTAPAPAPQGTESAPPVIPAPAAGTTTP
ncbi:MAG: hypothetical protein JXX29_12810 [Deltaproteobacteria bacterium]|nr:hypothetical protein [Deltaproteobacteria bacterium]MBN2672557.1 hypothetical protein [Deltaproteobacteria bacterium]